MKVHVLSLYLPTTLMESATIVTLEVLLESVTAFLKVATTSSDVGIELAGAVLLNSSRTTAWTSPMSGLGWEKRTRLSNSIV